MQNLNNKNILTRGESGVIAGVCSGLATYYGLRINGLRLAFLLTSFFFAIPVFVYIVLWLVLPKYPNSKAMARQLRRKAEQRNGIGS
jgi:phage shock protein PspC (stress-responsive transcriptional regulator)